MSHRLAGDSDENRQREHLECLEHRIVELEGRVAELQCLVETLITGMHSALGCKAEDAPHG